MVNQQPRTLQCVRCGTWWQRGQDTCHGCGVATWMRVYGAASSSTGGFFVFALILLGMLFVATALGILWAYSGVLT